MPHGQEYLEEAVRKWRRFEKTNPEDAQKLKDNILGVCADMTSAEAGDQIRVMLSSPKISEFKKIALDHAKELGIDELTDAGLALWIRTMCFARIMQLECT